MKNFSYALVDGEVYFRENSVMVRPQLNNTARERVKGMIGLKDCVRQLIDLQMDEYSPDSAIQQKQAELNTLYDSFTEKAFSTAVEIGWLSRMIQPTISCVPWKFWMMMETSSARRICSPSVPFSPTRL